MTEDALARVGLIGFGEVGTCFGSQMVAHGAEVLAYDIMAGNGEGAEDLRNRAESASVQIVSLEEVARLDLVLSIVTTQVAVQVAQNCAPMLGPNSIFVDLNSSSPAIKLEINEIMEMHDKSFVEGAILGAVGATGAKTRTLLAGERADEVAELLNDLGLRMEDYSKLVGKASAFKMLRSVFSKGFEAILIEMLIAGERAGIAEDLWHDMTSFMNAKPFDMIAANWITSHVVAHERRYHEMCQVSATLSEMDLEPLMTRSTEAFFKRSGTLELDDYFSKKPERWQEVVVRMGIALENN